MQRYKLALLLAFIPCIIPRILHPVPRLHMEDFEVYYSAALLARQHQGAAIYAGADNGSDPQLKYAQADTPIAITGRRAGIAKIRLYVYPPILADLLIPFSLVALLRAKIAWYILNIAAILLIVHMLVRIMGRAGHRPVVTMVLLGLLLSFPAYSCLFWGQVTLLLTLCWMFGIYAHWKGWPVSSASSLALATSIKLTPLVVLVPFIIWKDWKWLRAYAGSLLCLVLFMGAVSSPYALKDYFSNVVPSMSRGIPDLANMTIAAATQFLYVALHGVSILPMGMPIPDSVISVGKILSLAALVFTVIVPVYRYRKIMTPRDQVNAIALIAMVSPAVAPVSWSHAYTVCYPALVLLWGQAFVRRVSNLQLTLLTAGSIILNSVVMKNVAEVLIRSGSHRVLGSLMILVMPLAALTLVHMGFRGMTSEPAAETSVAVAA